MLAFVFLALGFLVGRVWIERLFGAAIDRARSSAPEALPRCVVLLPISLVAGTMAMGWVTYLTAYLAQDSANPLLWGNIGAAVFATVALTPLFRPSVRTRYNECMGAWHPRGLFRLEAVLTGICMLVACLLMWRTLRIDAADRLYVGISVFSDFGPHLAVIRSFSFGHNFPTEYPHFPDGSARYHFMFQFLAGNLEYLGLPLDWAFNVPSVLGFVCCCLGLYALAVVITGSRAAGVLAVLFFFFRSSFVWLDLLGKHSPGDWWSAVWKNDEFIGRTRHEDWGLWNQNIFVNQRHLPFALTLLWFSLVLCFPLLLRMRDAVASASGFKPKLREFMWAADAWAPRARADLARAIALGALIGIGGFWNGAVLIAALMVLCGFALLSKHRLEYLALALTTGALAYAQNRLFLGPGSLAVAPRINFGFLAEDPKTLGSVLRYYSDLLGPLPWVLLAALVFWRRHRVPWLAALAAVFVIPVVFASTVQLTPDVAINHKYVMIAVMLLNIVAAGWLAALWKRDRVWCGACVLILAFLLTATGIVDAIALFNRNRTERAIVVQLQDPLLKWARENTRPDEVLLTDWHSLHPFLLSGRRIFYGWPYYAWSAGYDTATREDVVKRIYGGSDREEIVRLMRAHGMRYIVIDHGNREQKLYQLQEAALRQFFPTVFAHHDVVILRVDS
jgi:hypothetical protein